MADHSSRTHTNRLIHQTSPYLRQHAHNPVDWFPWGDEAFQRARAENKPIFLSIGYSTCHWCHVMERESFENEALAAALNEHFVCIKVDREERPDIDQIYMTAVQATTGAGGWPMSVWLTPDLEPFYCGTYFPPAARDGRPGFSQLIGRIHEVWEANRDGVVAQARQLTASLREHLALPDAGAAGAPLTAAPLTAGREVFANSFDSIHGGFGGAPKFPRPVVLNFLFRAGDADPALFTLRRMAEGGLFDQLGGGFHRYSVDEQWLVSHFEKMLYDQAQLVTSYCEAFQVTGDPFFADIARRACDYVLRDLTAPSGGFYSAEDADSEGVEGKFYVWTRAEIETLLGDRAEAFCRAYGVTEDGNWEEGNNVLHVVAPGEFATERAILFAARERRIRPQRDEKILTAWNGLMISALCKAAQTLPDESLAAAATRAATYLLERHVREGRLTRTPRAAAVLDDYAFFANALVDLYETTFDTAWLTRASELAATMIALFGDAAQGGFFVTTGADPSVLIRAKEAHDGAEPSGNSVAAQALWRLALFTGRAEFRAAAERTLTAFRGQLARAPHAMPQMLCALDAALRPAQEIVIAGRPDAPDTAALLRVVRQRFLPRAIVLLADGATELPLTRGRGLVAGRATAYVCENQTCRLPTSDPAELATLLDALTKENP